MKKLILSIATLTGVFTVASSAAVLTWAGPAGAQDFNSANWNVTSGPTGQLPTYDNGTANNFEYGTTGPAGSRQLALSADIVTGVPVNNPAGMVLRRGGDSFTLNSGGRIALANIGSENFNQSATSVVVNGGTFSMNQIVNGTDKRSNFIVNGGSVTIGSVAGNRAFMDKILFNLSQANVTVTSSFDLNSAPDVEFVLGAGFNTISAGSSFARLDGTKTTLTLASNPGWTVGQTFTLVNSSNGGNTFLNPGTYNFAGAFGGSYSLTKIGNNLGFTVITAPIPEPSSLMLLGIASALFLMRRGRKI